MEARRLIAADIGGTQARLGVVEADAGGTLRMLAWQTCPGAQYDSFDTILARFLSTEPAAAGVERMVLASAGVVQGDGILSANLPWRVSLAALRRVSGLHDVRFLNDFVAAAHGIDHLGRDRLRLLTPDATSAAPGPSLVIGPGTGLGSALRLSQGEQVRVLPFEAGMAAFAPGNERELDVLRWTMRRDGGAVCTERLVSGPGLANLYRALCALQGEAAHHHTAAAITAAARTGDGPAREAVLMLCTLLGSVIGDLAATSGARSAYVAGGVLPHIVDFLPHSRFHARLADKGALRTVLERVPVWMADDPQLGVLGAASWYLQEHGIINGETAGTTTASN